jgi:hypothetical protein
MLTPFEAEQMRRYPVSARVNFVANDDRECSEPIDSVPTQVALF